ncbi:hypothetical protein VPHD520_0088 [Vibrio phage D520]
MLRTVLVMVFIALMLTVAQRSYAVTYLDDTFDLEDMSGARIIKSMNCADAPQEVQQIQWMHTFAIKEWDNIDDSVKRRVMLKLDEMRQIQELCPRTLEAYNDNHK